MREEDEANWFARWEEQLPSPEELTPLSQTLITPDLALAFDIPSAAACPAAAPSNYHSSAAAPDFDTSDLNSAGGDEPARTLKRPRLVWTPQLHKRFVDAVAQIGIKNAVPKTIMQLMSVDGLTRENVASHLQKYRLYLKRMQALSASSAGAGGASGPGADSATDLLFASAPVPHHFLGQGMPASSGSGAQPEPFLPFMPVAALQHQQQITASIHQHVQQQYYHQRQVSQFGSPTGCGGGGLGHGFLGRNMAMQGKVGSAAGIGLVQPSPSPSLAASYIDESESGGRDSRGGGYNGRRKELTLFPTGGGDEY